MIELELDQLQNQNASAVISDLLQDSERVIIKHGGHPIAALVSVEDLELLEAVEEEMDRERFEEAMSSPISITWETVKDELEPNT